MFYHNLGLICMKAITKDRLSYFFATNTITDRHILDLSADSAYVFPLYLYDGEKVDLNPNKQQSLIPEEQPVLKAGGKRPNFSQQFLDQIDKELISPDPANRKISYEEIFYYIYAVLYSNVYLKKYQEFLKIDFPRIPFTKDYKLFKQMVILGEKLVNLHLLKSSELDYPIAKFQGKNSNLVEKRKYDEKRKRAYINDQQYFEGITPEVWNYYIGGYQVLDKWLKDRKGRHLSSEDVKHYCRVVTTLSETIKIQKQIDKLYPAIEKDLIGDKG